MAKNNITEHNRLARNIPIIKPETKLHPEFKLLQKSYTMIKQGQKTQHNYGNIYRSNLE